MNHMQNKFQQGCINDLPGSLCKAIVDSKHVYEPRVSRYLNSPHKTDGEIAPLSLLYKWNRLR